MIFDGENLFFDHKALSAGELVSDVVFVGEGEAACPLCLFLGVSENTTNGTASTVIETSADEAFTDATTLGTFTAVPLSVTVPRGNLGYLRLKVTSTYSTGELTAGLILDDDIVKKD